MTENYQIEEIPHNILRQSYSKYLYTGNVCDGKNMEQKFFFSSIFCVYGKSSQEISQNSKVGKYMQFLRKIMYFRKFNIQVLRKCILYFWECVEFQEKNFCISHKFDKNRFVKSIWSIMRNDGQSCFWFRFWFYSWII